MTRDGSVVDPTGIPLDAGGVRERETGFLSVASDGRDFLVAIERSGATDFVKVTREGAIATAPASTFPSWYGGKLIWLGDAYAYFFDGQYAIIDRDGRVLAGARALVTSPVPVRDASYTVGSDGTTGLLSWIDPNDGGVYASVMEVAQVRSGSAHVNTKPAAGRNDGQTVGLSVASSGSRFFLVWSESATLLARLLDRNGLAIGEKFTVGRGIDPTVAWNGSRFVVAYSKLGDPNDVLAVSEYSEDGTLVATPLRPGRSAARRHARRLDPLHGHGQLQTGSPRRHPRRARIPASGRGDPRIEVGAEI
ncbi:MAG TPA: hypothetical protein VM733_18660 [Thermoanaerobaculia bacterium]|nr:hypothetical protein [Thermoanaerobaculia bacterium]